MMRKLTQNILQNILPALLLLCSIPGWGQGGAATPLKHGTSLPSGAAMDSVFALDGGGSPGVYHCIHTPTCTNAGQWEGPFGTGTGGTCSGTCANLALSNLSGVAIQVPLASAAGLPLNIVGAADDAGGGHAAQDLNLTGGAGGNNGIAGNVNARGGSNSGTKQGGGVYIASGQNPAGAADAGNVIIGGAGGCTIGTPGCSTATANGGSVSIYAGAGSGAGGSAGSITLQAGPPLSILTQGVVHISTIKRQSNVVTASTSTNTDMSWCGVGTPITVSGVTDSSFNGSFTLTSCTPGLQTTMVWSQSGTNANSTNGTIIGTGGVTNNSTGHLAFFGQGAIVQSADANGGLQFYSGTTANPGEIDFETFGNTGLFKIFSGKFYWNADGGQDFDDATHRPMDAYFKGTVHANSFSSDVNGAYAPLAGPAFQNAGPTPPTTPTPAPTDQSLAVVNSQFVTGPIAKSNPATVDLSEARVDGTINMSFAAASFSVPCVGAAGANHGCDIVDDRPEVLQAWPVLGSLQAQATFKHGNSNSGLWWTTVPIIASNDQWVGSGPVNSTSDPSTGTEFKACRGEAACGGLYFPNATPVPPNAGGTANTAAGSLSGNYYLKIVWLVNLNTAPDAKVTTSQPAWPANALVYPGYVIKDNSSHCSGPCTQMALNSGTTGNSQPAVWSNVLQVTNDNGVQWLNVSAFTSGATTYGAPGQSMAGPEQGPVNVNGSTNHSIAISAIAAPTYDSSYNCSSQNYTTGTIVRGPSPTYDHLYRAVGNSTSGANCNMPATAGSQTLDSATSSPALYWNEVGPVTNFIAPIGYLVYASTTSGTETAQDTAGCGTVVQVGPIKACAVGSTYSLTSLTAGQNLPLFDTTHPLTVLGLLKNNNSGSSLQTQASLFRNMALDTNGIAGEAELNLFGQELGGYFDVKAIGGDECVSAAIAPGAQNANLYNFNFTNPNSGGFFLQRLGGLCLDNRVGTTYKTIVGGTTTLYANPAGTLAPYDYYSSGSANFFGTHAENAVDGFYCNGTDASHRAICNFGGVSSGSGGTTNTNTVHVGPFVDSFSVLGKVGGATNLVQDDTVPAGKGNCNSNNSYCVPNNGTYVGGQIPFQTGPLGMVSRRYSLAGATSLVSGDFALSGGWGSGVSISGITGKDGAFGFQVTAGSSGFSANPTVTLTFHDGAYGSTPLYVCSQTGGTATTSPITLTGGSATTTTLPMIWGGTATSGQTVIITCVGMGRS